MDIVVDVAILLVAWIFLLVVAVALAVVLNESLSKPVPHSKRTRLENVHRIGAEARQAIDQASECFMRQVEHLFSHQLERS